MFGIVGINSPGEAVDGIVRHGESGIEIGSLRHGQNRPEDLFLENPRFGAHVRNHRGCDVVAIAGGQRACEQPPLTLADFNVFEDRPLRPRADHRPHVEGRIIRRTHLDFLRTRLQLRYKFIVNIRVHNGARARRTLLALIAEG